MSQVEGVDYSAAGIEDVRTALIELRDAALSVQHFESAVLLSHAIVLLAQLLEYRAVAAAAITGRNASEVHHGQSPATPAGTIERQRVETMEGNTEL